MATWLGSRTDLSSNIVIKLTPTFKQFSLTSTWLWLTLFALVPVIIVLSASFLHSNQNHLLAKPFTISNYQLLFQWVYAKIMLRSLIIAATCTLLCLLIGFPFAYAIANAKPSRRPLLLLLVIIPFWTSSLIRIYAIITLVNAKGLINSVLIGLGAIHQPLQILYTNTAVIIGLVYALLPYMILPLYANLEKLDHNQIEAARDLGANPFTILRKIIIPQAKPGIIAGIILVLLPTMTLFYIPVLLGGARSMLLGNLIENQFLVVNNWPAGAVFSIALFPIMYGLYLLCKKHSHNVAGLIQ